MTSKLKFESDGDGKKYEVEAICDSAVYARESEGHLPGIYYLVSWKGYPEEENTWEPALAVLHLRKIISTFHCDHPDKPTVTFPPMDSAPPMAKPTVRLEALSTKRKCGRPAKANGTSKRAKKSWTSSFYLIFGPVLIAGKRFLQSHGPSPLRFAPQFNFWFFHISRFSPIFWFFLLGIGQEVFSTNYLDLSGFLHQSPRGLEVFYWLTYRFSFTISC